MSHFNKVANEWDSEGKTKMMQKLASETLKKLALSSKVDMMDFGCGTGLFGLEFIEYAKSLKGIDVSAGMLEGFDRKTDQQTEISSLKLDLEANELEDTFDLIVSSMAFHHLNTPLQVLLKLKKALRAGGKIAIVDLNEEDGSFHPDNEGMGVKHFGFSQAELSLWANKAGLSIEHSFINNIAKNGKEYKQFLAIYS